MAIDIISLIIACGAVIVSILSHIRKSSCFGVIDIETRENTDDLKVPLLKKGDDK